MLVALAMPNWITGFVGYVRAESESIFKEIADYIYYTCYMQSFDLIKVPPFKRTCVVKVFRNLVQRYSIEYMLVYADPYRCVNTLCTKYRVNRNLVIPRAYQAIFEYLVESGLIRREYTIHVDTELGQHLTVFTGQFNIEVKQEAPTVNLAVLVASIPDVSTVEVRDQRQCRFRVGDERINVKIVDAHSFVEERVVKHIQSLTSGSSSQ